MVFLSLLVLHDKRKVKEQSLQEYFLHTFFSFQFHRHISFSPKYALKERYKNTLKNIRGMQFTDDITKGYLFISSMLLKAALSRMINGGIYGQNIFQ